MRQGFTIVEMLVVIAVVCLLFALLFPVVTKAKDWSHRAVCISNLRQVGIAIHAYHLDNRDLPGYYWWKAPSPRIYRNDDMTTLFPHYTPDWEVFVCPSTLNSINNLTDLNHSALGYNSPGSSYEYIKSSQVKLGERRKADNTVKPLLYDIDSRGVNSIVDADDNHVKLGGGVMLFPDSTAEWVEAKDWMPLVTNLPNP